MFQRKANLPTRPSIPSKEEILEDLSSANLDDVVFKIETETNFIDDNEGLNGTKESDDNHQKGSNPIESPDQAYEKISSFVDKMNNLEERLLTLKREKESLSKLEESLIADMSKIQKELLKKQSPST
uniref:Uncharacterized protein n=1 Tax=Parasteatoda tepidariorum TaxID=114398 RepID=A0A2L2YAZ0_PARTP